MSENSRPAIRFEQVSKRFLLESQKPQSVLETFISAFRRKPPGEELWAVRDLTFDIQPGDSLGIIGRNGAGKSTLLKLIARILRPTSGRLVVQGRVSALLELGAGFHPDLTGRENIYLNGSVLGLNKEEIDHSYQSIVDFSELGHFIDMPVKHYSSGMYMRLGFSVAIHVQPDILLIDEILAVGDQEFQTKCVNHIYGLQKRGVTIVMVSHHSEVIRSICSHALWIEHGEVQKAGPTPAVMSAYTSRYAQPNRPNRQDRGQGFRWGTGEAEIDGVRLCGPDGEEKSDFAPHEGLHVVIDYTFHRPLHRPHFDVLIYREDGLQITDSNPIPAGPLTGQLSGRGTMVYRFAGLPLLPGEYKLTVAIHDGRLAHAYDCHEMVHPFQINGDTQDVSGLISISTSGEFLP